MCELIISVEDKTSDDPAVECKLVKRGVVVDVFEDDHDYGRMELTHPMFRILKLPGVSASFGRSFMDSEIGSHPFTLKWAFKIDLDHPAVTADLKTHLADHTRATSSFICDQATIQVLKTKRVVIHPHDIGAPTNIIG